MWLYSHRYCQTTLQRGTNNLYIHCMSGIRIFPVAKTEYYLLIFLISANLMGENHIWLFCRRFLMFSIFILCLLHMAYFLLVSCLSFNYICSFIFGDTDISNLLKVKFTHHFPSVPTITHISVIFSFNRWLILCKLHGVLAWQRLEEHGIYSHISHTGEFPHSPPLKKAGASQCSASRWALFQQRRANSLPYCLRQSLTHSRLWVPTWSAWHRGPRPKTKDQAHREASIWLSMAGLLSQECLDTLCEDDQPTSRLPQSQMEQTAWGTASLTWQKQTPEH